jgi:hypothetical protein
MVTHALEMSMFAAIFIQLFTYGKLVEANSSFNGCLSNPNSVDFCWTQEQKSLIPGAEIIHH